MTSTSACPRTACVCVLRGFASKSCPALDSDVPSEDGLPEDFAAFHDAHRVNLLKYIRFRGFSFHDAEDVVNDVFLRLYRIRGRLWGSENPEAFAFKVAQDAVADYCKKKDRQPLAAGLGNDNLYGERAGQEKSNSEVDALIARLDMQRKLDRLPPRQADCMRLHALLDQDINAISRYLGITPTAVTSHLYYARQRLAAMAAGEDTL